MADTCTSSLTTLYIPNMINKTSQKKRKKNSIPQYSKSQCVSMIIVPVHQSLRDLEKWNYMAELTVLNCCLLASINFVIVDDTTNIIYGAVSTYLTHVSTLEKWEKGRKRIECLALRSAAGSRGQRSFRARGKGSRLSAFMLHLARNDKRVRHAA